MLHLKIESEIVIETLAGKTFTLEVDGCDHIGIVKYMVQVNKSTSSSDSLRLISDMICSS